MSSGKSMYDEAGPGSGWEVSSWVRVSACISRVRSQAWAWLWCSCNIDWLGPKEPEPELKTRSWVNRRWGGTSLSPPSSLPKITSCTTARWPGPEPRQPTLLEGTGGDLRALTWGEIVLTHFCQTGVFLCSCITSYSSPGSLCRSYHFP